MTRAYDEIVDFIAAGTTPDAVANFEPSQDTKEYVADLIHKEKTIGLTADEASELDHHLKLEHLLRLVKARAQGFCGIRGSQVIESGRGLLRTWFDSVESQLLTEATRAGLFRHPSMTGGAREEVIRRALRDILPPNVHLGSGRVIGADSQPSKQIDIVVFDGRFPVLRMGEVSLFPVEGVIATIEVKTELTKSELHGALLNALSVMQIAASFVKEDADSWIAHREINGVSREQALEEIQWRLMPRTYVFAFDGLRSRDSQSTAFQECLALDFRATPSRPLIPSVIVGGAAVTLALDDQLTVHSDDGDEDVSRKQIAITFESPTRFGILASHLLLHLDQRTQMLEPPGTIRRAMQSYLPLAEYINDCINAQEYAVTLWQERTSWDAKRTVV